MQAKVTSSHEEGEAKRQDGTRLACFTAINVADPTQTLSWQRRVVVELHRRDALASSAT